MSGSARPKPYVTWTFAVECNGKWFSHSLNDDENNEAAAVAYRAKYISQGQLVGPLVRIALPRPTKKTVRAMLAEPARVAKVPVA